MTIVTCLNMIIQSNACNILPRENVGHISIVSVKLLFSRFTLIQKCIYIQK